MDIDVAKELVDWNPDLQLREDYSGRAMYGRQTAAIVADSDHEFYEAVDAINQERVNNDGYDAELISVANIRKDNMGLSFVYY